MSPSVSLIIPSYNRARLIGETIDSALAQNEPFLEIIVVDDGSTDETAQVLAGYGDKIKTIFLENGGVQTARNVGVAHASGRFITLCDSDDLLTPSFLSTAMDWFRRKPEFDAFYSNFVTFNDLGIHPDKFSHAPADFFVGAKTDGEFIHSIPDLYARTVEYQLLFMSGCIVSKALYERIGGFNKLFNNIGGEDWEFTLRVVSNANVALCKSPLVRIRKHPSNQSGDSIRQVRGTAKILDYALNHHPVAANFRHVITKSIEERRMSVFHVAFAQGKFSIAEEMLNLLQKWPTSPKFWLKLLITKLPEKARTTLWKFTQNLSSK